MEGERYVEKDDHMPTRQNQHTNKSIKKNTYVDDEHILLHDPLAQTVQQSIKQVLDRLNAGQQIEEVKDQKKKSRKRQLKEQQESSSESDEEVEGVEHLTGLGQDKNGKWCVNICSYQDLYDNATKGQKSQLDRKFNRGTEQSGKVHFNEKHRPGSPYHYGAKN